MIENNLLKSNFLGRDGFRWWIGQVPGKKSWLLQYRQRPEAWGNRVKVRIMGYHPQNTTELSDDDLPWAQVILSPQLGSGKAGNFKPIKLAPGDVVVGFFLDGDDAQQPVIFGVIGNSKYVINQGESPFVPFTGYTDEVKPEGKLLVSDETGDASGESSQKSPRIVDKKLEKKLNEKGKPIKNRRGRIIGYEKNERTVSKAVGQNVSFAGTPASEEISNDLENAVKDVADATPQQRSKIISEASKKITVVSNQLTGDLTKSATNSLIPQLNSGLHQKYNEVYSLTLLATQNSAIAKKAGTAAQTAMVPAVASLQKKLPCVLEAVANNMLPDVTSLLTSFLDNVVSFTPCIADQFVGALFNKIVDGINDALGPELSGVGSILGGFNLVNDLRSKAEGLIGIQEIIKCVTNDSTPVETNIWTLGKGAKNIPGIAGGTIMEIANAALAIQEAAGAPGGIAGSLLGEFDFLNPNVSTQGFSSVLGECYTGPPLDCKKISVNLFGGDGKNAAAESIVGSIVGDSLAQQTGSIIGIKITNPGEGYTVPPLVEIKDACDNGYGANARAIIDYDQKSPTFGQVTDVIVVTPGENYPVIEENSNDSYTIDHVVVVDSGESYERNDVITDNVGNEYIFFLDDNGKILNVIPSNSENTDVIPITNLPELSIQTSTGFGAILKPQISPRPQYQGEIKQVIDCITPRDGIVGFVNGDPYYGPFHVHPTTGVKMVGVAHTTSPHAIIYDTPSESRASNVVISNVSTTVPTNVSSTTTQTTSSSTTETNTTNNTNQQTTGQSNTSVSDNNSNNSGSSGTSGYSGY